MSQRLTQRIGLAHVPIGRFAGVTGLTLVSRAVGMLGSVWLARNLAPSQLGLIAFIVTCQNPISRIISLGLEPILVRVTKSMSVPDAKAVFRRYFFLRVIAAGIAILVWLAVFGGVWFTGSEQLAVIGLILAPMLITTSIGWGGVAQRFDLMRRVAVFDLFTCCVSSFLLISFFKTGDTLNKAAMLTLVGSSVGWLGALVWASGQLDGLYQSSDRFVFRDKIRISAGLWPLLISLASYGYTALEIPLVASLHGFEAAGFYRVGATLPMAVFVFVYTFGDIMYPYYVEWSGNSQLLRARLTQLGRISAIFIGLAVVCCALSGRWLLQILFGETYAAAHLIFVILFAAKLVVIWVNVWSLPLLALGHEKFVGRLALAVSVSCLALNFLAKWVGFNAVSVAALSLISELTVGFFCYFRINKVLT